MNIAARNDWKNKGSFFKRSGKRKSGPVQTYTHKPVVKTYSAPKFGRHAW